MRAKEFTRETIAPITPVAPVATRPIDQIISQAEQPVDINQATSAKPATPYNQSTVGNWIGGKSTNPIAKAINPTNVIDKLGGVAGGLNNALKLGAQSGLGGVEVAYKGSPDQQAAAAEKPTTAGNQPIDYIPGKIDAYVADYLTKSAKGQPAKQATGNVEIDKILKAAGILK
jgi:hypothetical protein